MTWINRCLWFPFLSATAVLIAAGCVKNDWEEMEKHEQELIQQYLTENGISEDTKTEGGIYYIEEETGTGLSPVKDDYIVIDFVGRYIENNTILETSYDSLKNEWPSYPKFTNYVFGPVKLKYGYNAAGFVEGLSLMKEGGKAKLIIPSDMAYYDYRPLVYEIELIKVIKDPVAYEDSVLNEYRVANGYTDDTKFDSIWFKETITPDPGDLRTVQTNDTVLFRFTGKLIDGFDGVLEDERIFDSNIGDTYPVKVVFGNTLKKVSGDILSVPQGLVMALDTMRAGTHATALLPYSVGFGTTGLINSLYGYTIVPAYQTILYDIFVEAIIPPAGK